MSGPRRRIADVLGRDELRALHERSDARGLFAVASTWAVVVGTFVGLAWATHLPLALRIPAFGLGLAVLGGRHLALAILHHEAAHRSLFRSAWLNDTLGDWLCARPGWNDVAKYRAHHLEHHRWTSREGDPDLSLVTPFPTTRVSLVRKLARDLFGVTGVKALVGRALMDAGVLRWTVTRDVVRLPREGRSIASYGVAFLRESWRMFVVNGLLFAALWAAGHPWLFLAWVGAYVTPFPLFLRLRSMAEHACTSVSSDPFQNTRTTRAGFVARAFVAPCGVNFHVEHHALPRVPFYRLAELHRLLRERGALRAPPGYLDVLREVSSAHSARNK